MGRKKAAAKTPEAPKADEKDTAVAPLATQDHPAAGYRADKGEALPPADIGLNPDRAK